MRHNPWSVCCPKCGKQAPFMPSDTCGGYACFFVAAKDAEATRMLYRPESSALQKRCKITRCVYEVLKYFI
jgi:hypothetical protein